MRTTGIVTVLGVAGCAATRDPGDLRPEALLILEAAETSDHGLALDALLGPREGPVEVPAVVRVWRRGLDGSTASCAGRVDVMELETYVRGVVPNEWVASWSAASLDAGAIAARTYAAFWVTAGGRYACADVDDTTWTQVFKDRTDPRTDDAVTRTAGAVAVRGDSLVYAEYSAENGPRTDLGVEDAVCAGRRVDGHGRGMCQWGTQRWAARGRDAAWMIAHYYPGARVAFADEALMDGVDLTVTAGEVFTLELAATNPGPERWAPGALSIATDGSAFVDPSWPEKDRARVWPDPVEPTETVRLAWTMRAPEVREATTYPEYFWLEGPLDEGPGSSGSWRITVSPRPLPPEVRPARPGWGRGLLGVVGVVGCVALAAYAARRTRLRVGAVGGMVVRRRR